MLGGLRLLLIGNENSAHPLPPPQPARAAAFYIWMYVCGKWAVRCISKMTTSRSIVSDMSFVFIVPSVSSRWGGQTAPTLSTSSCQICTQPCIRVCKCSHFGDFFCFHAHFTSVLIIMEGIFCLPPPLHPDWGSSQIVFSSEDGS